MRRLAGRHPSPAMVLAFIALLAALSGTAIALPGKNTVDSGDLKPNAVKSGDIGRGQVKNSDIGRNAVNGAKIRNNAITGADIRESSLGQVPSANSANSANTANTANRANSAGTVDKLETVGSYKRVTSSASDNDPVVARGAATEVPLLTSGAFDVYGKCFTDADNSTTFAEAHIRTRENGSIFDSPFFTLNGSGADGYLNTGTAEFPNRTIAQAAAGADSGAIYPAFVAEFFAAAPGGSSLNGHIGAAAKNGTPAGGNGIYGPGNVCIFGGNAIE
jgi:hypothetical protein